MTPSKPKSQAYKLPMMPIRDVVIFPGMMTPFIVGRELSVRALNAAIASNRRIFLATQHDADVDEPKLDEIFEVGTIAHVAESLKLPDGNVKVLVKSLDRAVILQATDTKGYLEATVSTMDHEPKMTPALQATIQRVQNLVDKYLKICHSRGQDSSLITKGITDPSRLSDEIAANLQLELEVKQNLLEIFDPVKRLELVAELLADEVAGLQKDGPH